MGLFFNEDINTLFVGGTEVSAVYMGSTKVWPVGLPVGTVFNFNYTGTVQEVELPAGKYKLQCWGAQGGNVTGTYAVEGSKGGYSEGILTLTKTTTLYVFVGGQGTSYTSSNSQVSTSMINGGWNGGGAGIMTSRYNSGDTDGRSFPRGGGGATDISTVTSALCYSGGRTTRDSASLLARCIVAGGGAGGSYAYYIKSSSSTSYSTYGSKEPFFCSSNFAQDSSIYSGQAWAWFYFPGTDLAGKQIRVTFDKATSSNVLLLYKTDSEDDYANNRTSIGKIGTDTLTVTYTLPNDIGVGVQFCVICYGEAGASTSGVMPSLFTIEIGTTTSSSTPYSISADTSKQGGGTSGKGQYPGTQTSAGTGGEFGLGASQSYTNYRYCAGGGGGGWYGGGTNKSDSSTSYINYSGGGSGFVNTAANAASRPSGYTGLQLDSGTTTAGDVSHPSTSGGTETGHRGNGYARITVMDEDGNGGNTGGSTPSVKISWDVKSGSWNSDSNTNAVDDTAYTCVSPGPNAETVIRCTFSGLTSITFNCVYKGESNYDYLTVGSLDTECTRSSYGTSLKGTSGTAKNIRFDCDTGTHFVEFCYSKDNSVDTTPDNATVYIKSYS